MGRRRIYESAAARTAAYRKRKAQEAQGTEQATVCLPDRPDAIAYYWQLRQQGKPQREALEAVFRTYPPKTN